MVTPGYCQLMARYNRWMNERLHALVAGMPDDERRRDRGAFFGSIQETLNHLLWGDRIWLGRFIDEPCTASNFGRGMFEAFDALAREREITDRKMLDWAGNVTQDWLDSTLTYTSKVDGKTRSMLHALAAMQLFNHGTHHRGQLSTLLKQAGLDIGATDLPWLPGAVRILD